MEDFSCSEEDYYCSDGDSCDGLEDDDGDMCNGLEEDDSDVNALPTAPSSKVITKESLLAAQREDLRSVTDLLSVRNHHARALLIHHRWNVEKVFSIYGDKGKAVLFAEAGVALVEDNDSSLLTSSKLMCNICMEDVSGTNMTKMDCGHSFCNTCWTEHFIVKINEGQSKRIRCMAYKCNDICDEACVKSLVGKHHPDLAEKYDRFLLESYIDDNERVKWCPSAPHCGNALRVEDVLCEVECSCGLQFCFSCLAETHSPCSCKMWDLWTQKCRDESETVNWLTVNTKSCPKCYKPVEKNGGCNLVVCICGQAFCWLCGGATGRDHTWTSISGHSCGRFKEEDLEKEKRAKRDLYRYMHYFNRYKAHTESLKLETSNLKDAVEQKVSILKDKEAEDRDFSWITDGLYRLFRSRKVLSLSYPFAYYMFGEDLFKDEMTEKEREIKQNLFEDQQQQFEQNIEKLSKLLEIAFDTLTYLELDDMKGKLLTFSALTDNFCKKMYQCIENELLKFRSHSIAPYHSKGIEKATEFSV